MTRTTDSLQTPTGPLVEKGWAMRKVRTGALVHDKEHRVPRESFQGSDLLEAGSRPADGQYPVGGFALGLGSQALLRGLDVVHQVGLQLQSRRSPGSLAQEVIRILESTLGYDNTAVLLVDRSARQLKPFALSEKAFGEDFSQAYERYTASHDLRLGIGVPGWVAQQGQSVLSSDILREPRLESAEREMRSVLFVPILVEGIVVGALGTESRLVGAFTPLDQQLLETVAGQIAIAIQNAHLSARVRSESVDADAKLQRRLVADLRAQVEELDAFNHTVAHDLKNPLSILLGYADALAYDYGSDEDEVLDQTVRIIIENGRRMENIIDELLLLAEVRTVEQIPLMPLDMQAVLDVTCRRLGNLIEEYQAVIVRPESWPLAMGYQPWVEEIWVNYMSNAIKYGGSAPRVEMGGELINGNMIRFWMRDSGPGIDAADQQRLFIPFTKLRQASTKGHGLGLSIVQRIARRLGGAVGVESEPDQGSTFWFTLPALPLGG
jgi:signal transduction histidine kinase